MQEDPPRMQAETTTGRDMLRAGCLSNEEARGPNARRLIAVLE